MRALILAGGLGTRMRPLTYTRPKHLLPIVNKPHIEHVFDLLQSHGIDEVVLLTSYLAEAFADTVERAATRSLKLHVAHEEEPLGTAGGLKNAERFVGDDTFLALNGDVLTSCDLSAAMAFHRDSGAEATLVLTPVEDPSAFGVVVKDERGRVSGFIEKPPRDEAPSNEINAGIYVMEPSVLQRIPSGEVWSAERQLFPELVEDGAMYAVATDAYWMDIGTPTKFLAANLDALAGRFDAGSGSEADGSIWGEGCEVSPTARVSSSSIGDRCRIEEGAEVISSVLLPGATVERGARVEECVLGEAAVVPSDIHAYRRYLADGERFRTEES